MELWINIKQDYVVTVDSKNGESLTGTLTHPWFLGRQSGY